MVTMTEQGKSAFNPNKGRGAREIDYLLRFHLANNRAKSEAVAESAEDEAIGELGRIFDSRSMLAKIATFEDNGWNLDGSMVVPPTREEQEQIKLEMGHIMPELSDGKGVYKNEQLIAIRMKNKHKLLAFTIDWGYTVARDFRIQFFSGNNKISKDEEEEIIENEKRVCMYENTFEEVDRIEIQVTRSAIPHRRVRVAEICLGVIKMYDKSNSKTLDITESIDPFNERVPANELDFTINDSKKEFNIFHPAEIYQYFQDKQQMTCEIGALDVDGIFRPVSMGVYYLQRPLLTGNSTKIQFKAVDVLGNLQDTIYNKGRFQKWTFAELVDAVKGHARVEIGYPKSFNGISFYTYLKTQSHAEALRTIAQATNTVLCVERTGTIAFRDLAWETMQRITPEDYRMTTGFSPSDDTVINTVNVEVSSLYTENKLSELAKIPLEETEFETITLEPCYVDNASVKIKWKSGKESTYYPQYAPAETEGMLAEIDGKTLILKGCKIGSNTSVISKTVRQPDERAYVYEVKGNPLIQEGNADAVAAYMLRMKAEKRRMVKNEYRGYPYLEMGDIIQYNTSKTNVEEEDTQPFFITKNTLHVSGGMQGTLEARER